MTSSLGNFELLVCHFEMEKSKALGDLGNFAKRGP